MSEDREDLLRALTVERFKTFDHVRSEKARRDLAAERRAALLRATDPYPIRLRPDVDD